MSKSKAAPLTQFQVARPTTFQVQPTPADNTQPASATIERKLKTFRIRMEASKQLALLKVHTEKNQEDLLAEALNLLFEQYGMPPVA